MPYPQYFIDDLKNCAEIMRSVVILSLLLILAIDVLGQEKPKAVLVDEMGPINCDDMLARVDNFGTQLQNDLTSRGLVVVSGANKHLVEKLKLEILFTSGSIQRRVDASRIRIVRGNETGDPKMTFWIIPMDGADPATPINPWDLTLPKGMKPSYFYTDEDGICSYPTLYKYLKELLAANVGLRLNVVLAEKNSRKFKKQAQSIAEDLGSYGKPRIRFFKDRTGSTLSADFWLVP